MDTSVCLEFTLTAPRLGHFPLPFSSAFLYQETCLLEIQSPFSSITHPTHLRNLVRSPLVLWTSASWGSYSLKGFWICVKWPKFYPPWDLWSSDWRHTQERPTVLFLHSGESKMKCTKTIIRIGVSPSFI